jgi:DNA ligase-associated metallophosphoesterase
VIEFVETHIAQTPVRLLASRALHWIAARTLLIADLHLGKADTFRAAGIPLPSGGTRRDLERLTQCVDQSGAHRVIVLGDFLHGSLRDVNWQREWHAWRETCRDLVIEVIGGNHDRSLAEFDLGVTLRGPAMQEGPFELRHAPRSGAAAHVICGHVHPVVRLPRIAGRWPAFILEPEQTVLPAFSVFTGGYEVPVGAGRVAVCAQQSIVLVGEG